MLVVSGVLIAAQHVFAHMGQPLERWQYFYTNIGAAYYAGKLGGSASWYPMLLARLRLATNPGQDVYQAVFFEQGIKFQYPTTSLLFIEWLRAVAAPAIRVLNLVNAAFIVATVVGMVLLTLGLADRAGLADVLAERRNRMLLAAVAAIATLCFYPLLKAVSLGQIQVLLDALFVFACYVYLRGQSVVSGVLLGLSTLIKPQFGLFLIWGLLRRDRPFIAGWIVPVALGLTASAVLYGPGWPVGHLKVLSFIGSHGESFYANESVNGLVHRLFQNGANLEFEPTEFAPYSPIVYGATVISSALLIVAGLVFGRRSPSGGRCVVSLMFAGVCFTIASPVAWEHHYDVLLPAFAFCLVSLLAGERGSGASLRVAWIVLAATFFLAANSLSMTNWLASTPFNILQSYLLFAAFGVLGLIRARQVPNDASLGQDERQDWLCRRHGGVASTARSGSTQLGRGDDGQYQYQQVGACPDRKRGATFLRTYTKRASPGGRKDAPYQPEERRCCSWKSLRPASIKRLSSPFCADGISVDSS